MSDLPTIVDEMTADLLINKEDWTITILHDRAFSDVLLNLEYNEKDGTLLFQFEDKEQFFGMDIFGEYADFMHENEVITIIQIDMKTNTIIEGLEVPLSIV